MTSQIISILPLMEPQVQTYHDPELDIQQPFDVAVVIPTILRSSLVDAVRSIFLQDIKGSVQILIGIDKIGEVDFNWNELLAERPNNMALTLFWPGYSTNSRNGGLHNAMGGGALRSILSFLANSQYIAYLDDDNWMSNDHLSSLHRTIQGKKWAFSRRWFVTEKDRQVLCADTWESVGPKKGVFASNFDGFVDTNCLMIDIHACGLFLSTWCRPVASDKKGRGADRNLFSKLKAITPYGDTNQTTVSYVVNDHDSNNQARLDHINKHKIKTGHDACKNWQDIPQDLPKRRIKPTHTRSYALWGDHQQPFDISVIIPTIGRKNLIKSVNSIKQQNFKGRVQILVGIDKMLGTDEVLKTLSHHLPENMGLVVFNPGYSTSVRHGGVNPAFDGGAMRTILSFLAHARHVAYLDDDNTWHPNHLSSLYKTIKNHHYAYSLRQFIHPDGVTFIATDVWESVGRGKGFFADKFNGFIDPNCLMLDLERCLTLLPLWSKPLPNDTEAMSADRMVFHFLIKRTKGARTNQPTVNYVLNTEDPMHDLRAMYLGYHWINAECASFKKRLSRATSFDAELVKSQPIKYK